MNNYLSDDYVYTLYKLPELKEIRKFYPIGLQFNPFLQQFPILPLYQYVYKTEDFICITISNYKLQQSYVKNKFIDSIITDLLLNLKINNILKKTIIKVSMSESIIVRYNLIYKILHYIKNKE